MCKPDKKASGNVKGTVTEAPVSAASYLAIGMIRTYQYTLSAFIGRSCRYAPSCSHYAETAIRRFGFWIGGWMGLARISRCNPLGSSGYDPVPEEVPVSGRWYFPWRYGLWTGAHIDASTKI